MPSITVDSALDERGNGIDDGDSLLMPLMEGTITGDDLVSASTAAGGDTAFLVAPLRVEAESLTRESGFKLENLGVASGDQVIKSPDDSVKARASYTFSGQDGIYDVSIGHFDENDGVSSLSLFVDGVEVESFLLDQQLGSSIANAQTAAVRVIEDVSIETGDVVELIGFSDGGEPLRCDYLEFAFQGVGEPPSLVVDTAEDVVNGSDGKTSLREAVALANATAGHDTVSFDASVFDGEAGDILRLTQGEIVITDAVTIDGGAAGVTITGDANADDVVLTGGITDVDASLDAGTLDDNGRIFNVTSASASTTLQGLTLTGGRGYSASYSSGPTSGGAVRSAAELSIIGTTVAGNILESESREIFGAGIYGLADVTVVDSTIQDNLALSDGAGGYGGGIWAGGDIELTNSTVSGNFLDTYGGAGGGVYSLGSVSLAGSSVSGNSGGGFFEMRGGGIYAASSVTLTESSVQDNRGYGELGGYGGGVHADSVVATASTISGNTIIGAEGSALGGGIRANSVTLVNSTIANNLARNFYGGDGGGIFADTVSLSNTTVTGNIARPSFYSYGGNGGGIVADTVESENSIVLGNFDQIEGAPSEIIGTVVETGPNIIGGVDPADVFENIDPDTGGGLLADNGGPTETVAILATGAAAGGADPATATETDQRGVARDADPDLGAFEAEEVSPPPPADFRVEAETLTRDSGFKVENLGAASGGQVIKSPDASVEARASFDFAGPDGVYDIDLGYFDENDGQASLAVFVNGVEVDSFVWDQNLGSPLATAETHAVRHIDDVSIETGDVVEIVGSSDGSEPLRVDYLEFASQGSPGEPPSLVVNTTEDVVDGSDGLTSLREAVALANASAGHDTVSFDASVFDGEAGDILRLTRGEIAITDAVTIDGGTAGVTITGDANDDDLVLTGGITAVEASLDAGVLDENSRIFNVTNASAATTLDGLTLTGGRATGSQSAAGGAVRSAADLTLVDTTIAGNVADGNANGGLTDALGAGVYSLGEVTLYGSAIINNLASSDGDPGHGGGIWAAGNVELTNSTVSGNSLDTYGGSGGGVYSLGSVTLTGSIVSDNSAVSFNETRGAGVFASYGVTLTDSTVRDNFGYGELGAYGGGIYADHVLATASTISGNGIAGGEGSGQGGGINANSVTLVNSTVANNLARNLYGGDGGGIFAGTVSLSNTTVTGNIARATIPNYTDPGEGGGILAGIVETENSIVLGNFDRIDGAPSEIVGTVVETGPNIIGGVDPADVFADIDPDTGGGLLTDNGGPTETVAILATGPAVGGADPATATETDQRGVARDADPDLGAFEAEEVTPPPPPAEFRVEAETLTRGSGFKVENLGAASGGQVIKSPDGSVEAHASFAFTGQDGTYDLALGYFDETDGASDLSVFVDGVEVDSFLFDQNLGSANANASTHTERQIDGVAIETGDVIELVGHSDGGEPLRIDYLAFTFVDDLIA